MILRKNRFITAILLLAAFGFSLYAEDDIEERAKKLSDNKTVLQQNKVKNLIESMTVKPVVKKTDEVKNVDQ